MAGSIEIICGCMWSGKSSSLNRRLKRAQIGKKKIQVFKPLVDTRDDLSATVSREGSSFPATAVRTAYDIAIHHLQEDTEIIGIDEAQFFDGSLVQFVSRWAKEGKRVIISGLDLDCKAEPFGYMPQLLALADKVTKLTAVCTTCGEDANRTQRIAGSYAHTIDVGSDQYEARCINHFCLPEPKF